MTSPQNLFLQIHLRGRQTWPMGSHAEDVPQNVSTSHLQHLIAGDHKHALAGYGLAGGAAGEAAEGRQQATPTQRHGWMNMAGQAVATGDWISRRSAPVVSMRRVSRLKSSCVVPASAPSGTPRPKCWNVAALPRCTSATSNVRRRVQYAARLASNCRRSPHTPISVTNVTCYLSCLDIRRSVLRRRGDRRSPLR